MGRINLLLEIIQGFYADFNIDMMVWIYRQYWAFSILFLYYIHQWSVLWASSVRDYNKKKMHVFQATQCSQKWEFLHTATQLLACHVAEVNVDSISWKLIELWSFHTFLWFLCSTFLTPEHCFKGSSRLKKKVEKSCSELYCFTPKIEGGNCPQAS